MSCCAPNQQANNDHVRVMLVIMTTFLINYSNRSNEPLAASRENWLIRKVYNNLKFCMRTKGQGGFAHRYYCSRMITTIYMNS